jgi:hypothetical protein
MKNSVVAPLNFLPVSQVQIILARFCIERHKSVYVFVTIFFYYTKELSAREASYQIISVVVKNIFVITSIQI